MPEGKHVSDASGVDVPDERQGGISRRTLIRRAAATGAVAWTAPMIIDSLASPAAAQTAPCGCTFVAGNAGNCNIDCNNTPCVAALPACDPLTLCRDEFTACVVAAQSPCFGDTAPVVFNISGNALCANCVFLAGAGNVGGQAPCGAGTISNGGKTITFPTNAAKYNQFAMKVNCVCES
jgi:hypothetical protein